MLLHHTLSRSQTHCETKDHVISFISDSNNNLCCCTLCPLLLVSVSSKTTEDCVLCRSPLRSSCCQQHCKLQSFDPITTDKIPSSSAPSPSPFAVGFVFALHPYHLCLCLASSSPLDLIIVIALGSCCRHWFCLYLMTTSLIASKGFNTSI